MRKTIPALFLALVFPVLTLLAQESFAPKPLYRIREYESSGPFQRIHSVHVDETSETLIILNEAPLKISVFNTFDGSPLREIQVFEKQFSPLFAAGCGRYLYVSSSKTILRYREDGNLTKGFPPPALPAGSHKMTCDRQGNFIFLNRTKASVVKYSPEGKTLFEIPSGDGEREGKNDRASGSMNDVAVDFPGGVYIADSAAREIKKYSADGKYAGALGGERDLASEEIECELVAVDSHRNVWVYDAADGRIKVFDSFGFLSGEMEEGEDEYRLISPEMIYVDRFDRLYVLDQGDGAVKVYSVRGFF